jgi:hypothetical protein
MTDIDTLTQRLLAIKSDGFGQVDRFCCYPIKVARALMADASAQHATPSC